MAPASLENQAPGASARVAYLTESEFEDLTIAPADVLASLPVGWLARQLSAWSNWIDARLRKRYAAPFVAPYPDIVCLWLSQLVTLRCYQKVGFNSADAQSELVVAQAQAAEDQITQAANAFEGLFELPLRQDLPGSGISRSYAHSATDYSPYTWFTRQRDNGRDE
jgi:hypothetical protein